MVDVALLPEHRRRGIGRHVYAEILAEADRRGVPVRTTVDRTNGPSLAFHARLGFEAIAEDAVRVSFERPVSAARRPKHATDPVVHDAIEHEVDARRRTVIRDAVTEVEVDVPGLAGQHLDRPSFELEKTASGFVCTGTWKRTSPSS